MAPQRDDKICVLLVDDDPDTRAMYAVALSLANVQVLESGDGATALSAASEFLPDVIVTDLSGPNLDGFELLEWLQANPKTARIRAIVLNRPHRRGNGPTCCGPACSISGQALFAQYSHVPRLPCVDRCGRLSEVDGGFEEGWRCQRSGWPVSG